MTRASEKNFTARFARGAENAEIECSEKKQTKIIDLVFSPVANPPSAGPLRPQRLCGKNILYS